MSYLVRSLGIGSFVLFSTGATHAAQWQPGPALPVSQPRLFAVGVNQNGTLLAIGGSPFSSGGAQDAPVHYLPLGATNWLAGTSVEGPIVRQGAGTDPAGRIVVFGGVDGADPEGDAGQVYVYDIVEGQWTGLADRTPAAPDDYFACATDAQHRIYSIGGGPGSSATVANPNSSHVERYIAGSDSWQTVAPMPHPLADGAACYDGNGRILVFGGFDAAASARLTDVLSYDVAADSWSTTAVPDMPIALTGHRAVLGADQRIYIIGGVSGPVGSAVSEARVWALNLQTNSWSSAPAMAVPRSHFAALLGDDDTIYAVGGLNDAGGTYGVETLYTPPCPVFIAQPASRTAWIGHYVSLNASAVGGGTISYQWRLNGIDLADGAQSYGTVSGSQTQSLAIASPTADATGNYTLIAVNDCGETVSALAVVTMQAPAALPPAWQVVALHPAGAINSYATGVSETDEAGYADMPDATYGQLTHPFVWNGSAAGAVDRTPSGSVGGSIAATAGNVQVGWWWWPYQCYVGGQWYTCYSRQACMWVNGVYTNLQYSGYEYSAAADTDGVQIVGSITTDDASGNVYTRAVYKSTLGTYWQVLHPAGASNSGASALDGNNQYGWIHTPFPGPVQHAAMWSGGAATFVDLQPPGVSRSSISGAGDGQQVGIAYFGNSAHAGLWSDSIASYVDLNPAGASGSSATDCAGGLQVGSAFNHAAIWSGAAGTYYDLHAHSLPAGYSSSTANDIYIGEGGAIRIVGSAYHSATQRTEAILWIAGTRAADLDHDGAVTVFDLFLLLGAWGNCPDPCPPSCAADLNDDCAVNVFDLFTLLGDWG